MKKGRKMRPLPIQPLIKQLKVVDCVLLNAKGKECILYTRLCLRHEKRAQDAPITCTTINKAVKGCRLCSFKSINEGIYYYK